MYFSCVPLVNLPVKEHIWRRCSHTNLMLVVWVIVILHCLLLQQYITLFSLSEPVGMGRESAHGHASSHIPVRTMVLMRDHKISSFTYKLAYHRFSLIDVFPLQLLCSSFLTFQPDRILSCSTKEHTYRISESFDRVVPMWFGQFFILAPFPFSFIYMSLLRRCRIAPPMLLIHALYLYKYRTYFVQLRFTVTFPFLL